MGRKNIEDYTYIKAKGIPHDKANHLSGDYIVTAKETTNIYDNASDDFDVIAEVIGGATVHCDGSYTTSRGIAWLYVTDGTVTGFMSVLDLRKVEE